MADEFLVFLFAGLVILGLGLLIASSMQPAEIKVANATVFETSFDVSYLSAVQEMDLSDKELFNGVFFGSNEIRQHIESEGIEKLTIKFTVAKTNNLAPLDMKVNGKTAAKDDYAIGEYSINVNKALLSGKMDIEIKPSSSLWKIWAPNLYNLKDVKVETRSLSFGKKESLFLLGSELDNFDQARVELVLDKNIGRMKVFVNGKEIFSGFLKNQQSIKVEKSGLKKGENTLELIPDANSRLSGLFRVVMFSKEARPAAPAEQEFMPLFALNGDP